MRKALITSIFIISVIASFYGGIRFGLEEGAKQYVYGSGLLQAESARRTLTQIEKGNLVESKALAELDLAKGLQAHYELMHYDYPLLLSSESKYIFAHDRTFMQRILAYLATHPEALHPKWDPNALPETTAEEKAFKKSGIEGQQQFDSDVAWVLDHYRASTYAPDAAAAQHRP